jgi:anti-sigma regulatory factor (Ser/Thr protein kinase)
LPSLWLTVPARPGQLVGLRRALRQWLAQAGVGESDAASIQVAVGEATSNAVEHAYLGAETGLMRLTARLDPDGLVSMQVIDNGRWREPAGHAAQRGRGFRLMRATMDDVQVHHRTDGTTVSLRLALGQRERGQRPQGPGSP